MPESVRYDAVVVGAGLIGAVAALGAADQGLQVLVVDRQAPAPGVGRLGIDIRNIALSPASRALLERVGAWRPEWAAAYRRMEVWEELGTRAMIFDAAEIGRRELGWIVENGPPAAALWEALQRHPNVTVLLGQVDAVAPGDSVVTVTVGDRAVPARLLIAADGARSAVREQLRVALETRPTGQTAVVTVVRCERPHEAVALQRFLLDGPLALLPSLDPHLCSVVWSQSTAQAERRLALSDAEFGHELARALQHRLGAVMDVDRRSGLPLVQQLCRTFNPHPRVLLVGDAAHVLHPLAGLGANVGFEDVRDLVTVLEGLGGGADPGTDGVWRAFDRRRGARARMMITAMSVLRQVYAQGDPLSQWLRNSAIGWLNRTVALKRQIVLEAMGLGPIAR
ncbi:MAG: FAD-dependent monooxygenase [Pseudomonadales bacterium]